MRRPRLGGGGHQPGPGSLSGGALLHRLTCGGRVVGELPTQPTQQAGEEPGHLHLAGPDAFGDIGLRSLFPEAHPEQLALLGAEQGPGLLNQQPGIAVIKSRIVDTSVRDR